MPKIVLAAAIDPEERGVGYFEILLEDVDRKQSLLEYFDFLGLPLIEASTFVSDYEIRFENEKFLVVVHNDDVGCKELGTTPEQTVYFSVWAESESDLRKFQKRIERSIRISKVNSP